MRLLLEDEEDEEDGDIYLYRVFVIFRCAGRTFLWMVVEIRFKVLKSQGLNF